MYQEVECNCESVAADVWSAHNCDLHGNHAEEYAPAECSACGETESAKLEMFECTGCDEVFCVSHRIMFDGEEACPDCALFWAQDAVKKMHMAIAKAVESRLAPKPQPAMPIQMSETASNQPHRPASIPWKISAAAAPVRKAPGFAMIGNGLYVRTGGKR